MAMRRRMHYDRQTIQPNLMSGSVAANGSELFDDVQSRFTKSSLSLQAFRTGCLICRIGWPLIQSRNTTIFETQSYGTMQWVNMSDLDSTMMININVQQNSKLLIQFSASISINGPASLQTRIVVDNNYISTVSKNSVGSSSTGIMTLSNHIEFLTDPLNSGAHIINLQILRENGSPTILDRTITIMEIAGP